MDVRTVGIEEEFLLVDPETGRLLKAPRRCSATSATTTQVEPSSTWWTGKLLRHMLEIRTEPSTDVADLGRQIVATRRTLRNAAAETGRLVACGTTPLAHDDVEVAPKARYRDMVAEFGALGRTAGTCGMHVHVGIESREEGVGVIDRLRAGCRSCSRSARTRRTSRRRQRLPSWRSQLWTRWPSAGPTEPFGS